jgi:hypothetical protein
VTVLEAESAVDKFDAPLYTQSEAARFLGLPESTFRNWARGYHVTLEGRDVVGEAVLSTVPRAGFRGPNIPFVGLAEGYALAAMRKTGVPLQRIRPAIELLDDEMGLKHALASQRLFTDGAEVLFDYADKTGGDEGEAVRELVVVRNNQRVLADVVQGYLQRIEFGGDGFATAIPLPGFEKAELVADVRRSFGQPVFRHGGARLEDALSLFKAERDIAVVAEEYGIPREEFEDVLAVLIKIA